MKLKTDLNNQKQVAYQKKMVKLVVLLLDASIWSMKGETFSNANI